MLGGFVIAGAIVFLLMAATPGSSGVELTMDQLIKTQAQHKNDYVTVQGAILVSAILVVVVNLVVDLLYIVIDPRIKEGKGLNL